MTDRSSRTGTTTGHSFLNELAASRSSELQAPLIGFGGVGVNCGSMAIWKIGADDARARQIRSLRPCGLAYDAQLGGRVLVAALEDGMPLPGGTWSAR